MRRFRLKLLIIASQEDFNFTACELTNKIQNTIYTELGKPLKKKVQSTGDYLEGVMTCGCFAVLGQFCAKVITWCIYLYKKCSFSVRKKISHRFCRKALTRLIFFG